MNLDQNQKHEQKEEENSNEIDRSDEKSVTKILKFEDFLSYMRTGLYMRKETYTFEKQMKYLFNGIDLDGLSYVTSRDAEFLLLCYYQKDYLNITKLFFCGADKNRDRKITTADISDSVNYLILRKMDKNKFEAKCRSEFGENKKELEFYEFYKIITSKDIIENYDPYEGRIKEKTSSSCCILI